MDRFAGHLTRVDIAYRNVYPLRRMVQARSKQLNLRLSPEELATIKCRADKYGLTVADIVRLWIRAGAPVALEKKKL